MCVLPIFVVNMFFSSFFHVYQNINYCGLYICTTLYCINLNGEASEKFCLSIPPHAILPSRLLYWVMGMKLYYLSYAVGFTILVSTCA